jgi:hypothetical protein
MRYLSPSGAVSGRVIVSAHARSIFDGTAAAPRGAVGFKPDTHPESNAATTSGNIFFIILSDLSRYHEYALRLN